MRTAAHRLPAYLNKLWYCNTMSRYSQFAGTALLLILIAPVTVAQTFDAEPDPAPSCPDQDKDGVCDGYDACSDRPGPESTSGCPDVEICHNDIDDDTDGAIDENCPDVMNEQLARFLLAAAIILSALAGYGVGRFYDRMQMDDDTEDGEEE